MHILLRKILPTTLLVILASLFLHGCARQYPRQQPKGPTVPVQEQTIRTEPQKQHQTIQEKAIEPEQEEKSIPAMKPRKGPAQTLFRDAERALEKGDYGQAEILLERALRVEPGNGWYWHAMGRVKYAQGSFEQTIQFCLKSNSLAGPDADLKRNNQLLLNKAYRKTGDSRVQ